MTFWCLEKNHTNMRHLVWSQSIFSGMCALFSTSVLVLTWWPLLRDCTFYSTSLITLVLFFTDQQITWYESAILLGIYGAYVVFMRWMAEEINNQNYNFQKIFWNFKIFSSKRAFKNDNLKPQASHSALKRVFTLKL